MSADYIQLIGTDVPGSYGSCCFSGQVHHEALRCPTEWVAHEDTHQKQEAKERERDAGSPQGPESTVRGKTTAEPLAGDGQLLFFNCPEGTQRFGTEANLRLVRTRGFFFTRWAATAVMGMPGLLFTVNDAGVRHANFFGPSTPVHDRQDVNENEENTKEYKEAYEEEWQPCEEERTGVSVKAGLAGMLDALRRHYFWYRKMRFQQLCAGLTLRRYTTPLPLNDVCEVPLPTTTPSSSLISQSGFVALSLLLSPTSALIAFRITSPAESPADVTYGYALVHAPAASFDPHRAKALGVPPGPLYGQLKQGTGVWIDKAWSTPVGVTTDRCYIDPRSVKQATVGSRQLYVSLVLDGDNWEDVAVAMEVLFGRAVVKNADGLQQQFVNKTDVVIHGDNDTTTTTNNNNNNNNNNRGPCGELRRFLQHWQPSLLYCDEVASDMAEEQREQRERSMELVHIIHVQNAEFFSKMGLGSLAAAQTHYITSTFAHVCEDIRVQAAPALFSHLSSTSQTNSLGKTPITTHHFCASLQQEFSAFPTALAHRYHLNSIAPAQFPLPFTSSEGEPDPVLESGVTTEVESHSTKGPVWPYGVKHQLIPASAATHIVAATHAPVEVSASTTTAVHLSSAVRGVNKSNSNIKNSDGSGDHKSHGKKRDVPGPLRYPTVRSAVAMLSPQFRAAITEVHHQQCQQHQRNALTSLTSPNPNPNHYQLDEKDNGGALTFLGTGSAVPSKYRNVSGTYLEVMYYTHDSDTAPRRVIIVLDFGEGNAGQLAMLLGGAGTQALQRFMEDLTLVFISHAHADHHLGLLSLLELRHRTLSETTLSSSNNSVRKREPLLVVCPQEVYEFLLEAWGYCSTYTPWLQQEVVFDIIPAERTYVNNYSDTHNGTNNNNNNNHLNSCASWTPTTPVLLPRLNALCTDLHNSTRITTRMDVDDSLTPPLWAAEVFPVHHPANAHALLLRFPAPTGNGTSRVMLFSGDTRPSPFLIERCHRFTRTHSKHTEANGNEELFLCLHEATFGEGCEEEAIQKCHSTLPEALQVAAAIRARHVVLNHFSQRYPKLPGLMKSQLDGKDVDLQGRRRRSGPPPPEVGSPCGKHTPVLYANDGEGAVELHPQGEEKKALAEGGTTRTTAQERKMCFGFDFMRLTFASMESGETARLTPVFVQLLEEYESWGVGTTKRLRD